MPITSAYEPHRLSDDLREQLNALHVRPLVEFIAERLTKNDGHQRIEFYLEDGNLKQTNFGYERVRNEVLEAMWRMR